MDIAALASGMKMAELQNKVSLSVAKMAMGKSSAGPSPEEQMVNMIKEMEISVNPNVGKNFDIKL